eukprot:11192057-Lingulodinium_polyedra.AAC.1
MPTGPPGGGHRCARAPLLQLAAHLVEEQHRQCPRLLQGEGQQLAALLDAERLGLRVEFGVKLDALGPRGRPPHH